MTARFRWVMTRGTGGRPRARSLSRSPWSVGGVRSKSRQSCTSPREGRNGSLAELGDAWLPEMMLDLDAGAIDPNQIEDRRPAAPGAVGRSAGGARDER